jgi:hypothetical protein
MSDTYDIQVTILRDGVEIGFCASLGDTIDHAAYAISTMLQRREWETSDGMPDPSEVDDA